MAGGRRVHDGRGRCGGGKGRSTTGTSASALPPLDTRPDNTANVIAPAPSPAPTIPTEPVVPSSPDHSGGSNTQLPPSASSAIGASSSSSKLQIRLVKKGDKHIILPSYQTSSHIREIFEERLDKDGYTWKDVTNQTKEFYWNEFLKYVSFDEPLEGLVKKAWSTKAAKRYSDTLSTWRDTWKEKGKKPQCVSLDTWNKWLQKWNSPEFKKKSDTASKNRRTEVAGEGSGPSRHTGGSRTFIEHAEDLAILLGRLANDFEIFKHTHGNRKKNNGDGDYIDKRSTDVALLVEELVADATAAGKQIDMSQLYMQVVQAVGGVKKQRVYGLGSNLSSSQIPSSSIPKSHEEVERIRAEAREEGRAEAQTELRTQMEEMSKKQEEFNKKLHLLMQLIGQGSETLPPPTNDEYHTEDDEDLGGD